MHATNHKSTILIVDDTPMNINVLFESLKNDYDIRIANRGDKALQICRSDSKPDLILLDIMMPGMDGYEVCRQLKNDPYTSSIPIIFITAKNEAEDEMMGLDLGAVDYITKPFNLKIVQARIRTHLRISQQSRLLEEYAYIDALTQIPNRRQFNTRYDEEWRRALRNHTHLSMCMIDIDYFKGYNDTLGHGAGDICLQKVATAINESVSRAGEIAARYGGEEFAVILPHCDENQCRQTAEKIREAVESLKIAHPTSIVSSYVTISIGCATHKPSVKEKSDQLQKDSDAALYRAKENGRNRVFMYDGSAHDEVLSKSNIDA